MTWANSRLNEQSKNKLKSFSTMPRIRCPQSVYFTVETLQNPRVMELQQEQKSHKIQSRKSRRQLEQNLALHYLENHGWTLEEVALFLEMMKKDQNPL